MRAMIIGAGMGGLTVAIALRRSGIEATIFERAGELREVGAGILLAANAVKALGELGISGKVHRLGTARRLPGYAPGAGTYSPTSP